MANVWALKAPDQSSKGKFVTDSVKSGVSRFGWSYIDNADLRNLSQKDWNAMTDSEAHIYSNSAFLMDIEPGDWIVHVNLPNWGECMAARVSAKYYFDPEKNELGKEYSQGGDFRHCIPIDTSSLVIFNRNNKNVLPQISRRLKLQGRYWRIYAVKDFIKSIDNLREGKADKEEISDVGIYYLKDDLEKSFASITKAIHKNHPGKKLEELIAQIFENMDGVINVKRNGSGWKSDHGADLIVDYSTGLPLTGLQKTEKLVVQIKSYTGSHVDVSAVHQIKQAIKRFGADAALIVSTAEPTDSIRIEIENAIEEIKSANEESEKIIPIELIAGNDVAKLLLRYGQNLLFESQ
ncbi:restriction endonuclease [Spirochaeta africana]|uniref:Restriction endonuclease n=1 Tax=Spirochaeta africana (strain ATCC 700263 / DSM 8902 / Z-7692) TaxID=889378 RepID=H9UHG2_SPIAZ|nr:restriction endonuclease [Spirochaeta africana]AFG36955.1 Restriction endonuclease [Spirochaeta africana DSM 8902]